MKKLTFILLIPFFLNLCSTAYLGKDRNLISWSEDRVLEWKDYKGRVPYKPVYGAVTYVKIDFKILTKNSIRVTNYMVKDKSWVDKKEATNRLLVHEQYHFHIAELYTRKMRCEMAKINVPSTKNVQEVFNEWATKYHQEQDLYDKETSRSTNYEEQLRWQEKIDKELKELEDYKEQVVYLNGSNNPSKGEEH